MGKLIKCVFISSIGYTNQHYVTQCLASLHLIQEHFSFSVKLEVKDLMQNPSVIQFNLSDFCNNIAAFVSFSVSYVLFVNWSVLKPASATMRLHEAISSPRHAQCLQPLWVYFKRIGREIYKTAFDELPGTPNERLSFVGLYGRFLKILRAPASSLYQFTKHLQALLFA